MALRQDGPGAALGDPTSATPSVQEQLLLQPSTLQPRASGWGGFCCRQRSRKGAMPQRPVSSPLGVARGDRPRSPSPVAQLERWVAPACDVEAEWKAVQRSVDADEFRRLQELRRLVEALDVHSACDTAVGNAPHSQQAGTLLRFLRARRGEPKVAALMLREALDWRRDFSIDDKLRAWRSEWEAGTSTRVKLFREYNYIGLMGCDREGLPVYVYRHSQGDLGGLVRELGDEPVLLHMVRMIEDSFLEARTMMLNTGRFLCSFIEVHDLGNYGLVPNWLPRAFGEFGFMKKFAPVFDKVYPERVRVCFLVRMPAAFSMIWRLASPLVPEATHSKLRLKGYAAASWVKEMEALLPESAVPDWLRSEDPALLLKARPWGGVVPKGALAS